MIHSKSDVVALGELLVDFVQQDSNSAGYPVLSGYPGGAPCNFLSVLARYGKCCKIAAAVGEDALGEHLIRTLQEQGIQTHLISRCPDRFTTLAFVTLDAEGNRTFSFARKHSADTALVLTPDLKEAILRTRVFHFGSLSLTEEPARSTTLTCARLAAEHGIWVSYDPNWRPSLWSSDEAAREQILTGLAWANSAKFSEEEFTFLFQMDHHTTQTEKIFSAYPRLNLLLLTRGELGATGFLRNGETVQISAMQGLCTIDTTGAGDIFGGAVLYMLLKQPQPLQEITSHTLRTAMQFASVCAGLSTTRHGGISSIPSHAEVEAHCSVFAPK